MKKILLVTTILSIISVKVRAQDSTANATTFTLKQCIETAVANNLAVRQAEYNADNSKVNLQLAKAQLLPNLNAAVSHGSNQGRNINPYTNTYINQSVNYANYGLDGSALLFGGMSVQNSIKQSMLSLEAGKMDAQQQRDAVTINVILAYLSVLSNQDQLDLAMQQAAVTQQQVERLEILNNEGAIAPATLYDMKGQLGTDELTVVKTKNALETAKLTLAQLMNIQYREDLVLAKVQDDAVPLNEEPVDDIYEQATANLALVKAAQLRHASARYGLKAAKGRLYPRIFVNGGLGTNYSSTGSIQQLLSTTDVVTDDYVMIENKKVPVFAPQPTFTESKINYGQQWKNNFNSYLNLTLSIPLLNGLQNKSRVRQAAILEQQTSYEEQTTRLQLRQAIEQAQVNRKAAYTMYSTISRQVKHYEESFRAADIRFKEGVITSVEYLIVKNNLDRANINLVTARYDYILRSKILDYYQAKPLW